MGLSHNTNRALAQVSLERERQEAKWGHQHHEPDRWLAILAEEFGEVAKDVVEGNERSLYVELTQVAAVAVAWMEDLAG